MGRSAYVVQRPVKLKQPWSILLICIDLQMPQQRAQKAIAGHLGAAMATILLDGRWDRMAKWMYVGCVQGVAMEVKSDAEVEL